MNVDLRAIPVTPDTYWLDCTECGPLGIYAKHLVRHTAATHLRSHGINTPEEPMNAITCGDCGYDFTHPTGHQTDQATCTTCDWHATGFAADHQGHHHHLDTGHTWRLILSGEPT